MAAPTTFITERIEFGNGQQGLTVTSSLLDDPIVSLQYPGFYSGALDSLAGAVLLPPQFDDALLAFGSTLYWRMLYDAQVRSNITYSARQATAERISVSSPLKETDPDYQLSLTVAAFVDDMLHRPDRPVMESVFDCCLARAVGHRIAVPIYAIEQWNGKDRTVLDEVRVKPQESYAFAVDNWRGWRGLVGLQQGGGIPSPDDVKRDRNMVVPRERFMHFAWDVLNHDPRGTSLCRAAYAWWWIKQQVIPGMLANAATFAQPGIKVKAAESNNSTDFQSPTTGTLSNMKRIQALVKMAEGYRNGGILGISEHDEAEIFESQGNGAVFINLINQANSEIAKAITSQTQLTEQGHGRAQGYVGMDVVSADILYTGFWAADGVRSGLARPLVMYNDWGVPPERARRMVPIITLGEVVRTDFPEIANAVAQLTSSTFLTPSQRQYWSRRLGSPAPTSAELTILTSNMEKPAPSPLANQSPAPKKTSGAQPQRNQPEGD